MFVESVPESDGDIERWAPDLRLSGKVCPWLGLHQWEMVGNGEIGSHLEL
jgi:hypothetical protein